MIFPKEPRFTQSWIGITPIYALVQVFITISMLYIQIRNDQLRVSDYGYFTISAGYVLNSVLAPALGLPLNPKAAAEAENILTKSLSTLESFWLKGNAKFLLGSNQPSIADLSLVCELTQLQVHKKHVLL